MKKSLLLVMLGFSVSVFAADVSGQLMNALELGSMLAAMSESQHRFDVEDWYIDPVHFTITNGEMNATATGMIGHQRGGNIAEFKVIEVPQTIIVQFVSEEQGNSIFACKFELGEHAINNFKKAKIGFASSKLYEEKEIEGDNSYDNKKLKIENVRYKMDVAIDMEGNFDLTQEILMPFQPTSYVISTKPVQAVLEGKSFPRVEINGMETPMAQLVFENSNK